MSRNLQTGAHTRTKLHQLYQARWGVRWPHETSYLNELWQEARDAHPNGTQRRAPPQAFEYTLDLMRECHAFTPTATPLHA